jgi:ABC-type dipeptide/oligopeptide/nickel transport system permease subunit
MRSVSALALMVVIGLVVFGPYFVSIDPLRTNPEVQLQPPSCEHLLGTDLLGRDVFSRVLYGGRLTLLIAAASTLLAVCIGVPIGGAVGMWPDRGLLMIVINALLAVPGLVIALVVVTLMGRGSIPMAVALAVAQAAPIAYMTRTAILTIRSETYVDAARGLGATSLHILWNHIYPNVRPALLPYTGIVFSYMLLNSAALSFIGAGNEPGTPDWGVMLAEGRAAFRTAPWIGIAPGAAITLIVWAVNDLVDRFSAR